MPSAGPTTDIHIYPKNRCTPYLRGEAAMDAENARIQAETRELVKRRPYGPWLFR
jgi:hypothetical protein